MKTSLARNVFVTLQHELKQRDDKLNHLMNEMKTHQESTKSLLKHLTEEVISLKNEIRCGRMNFQCDADLNLLPSLPLSNLNDLKEFDMQLSEEVGIKEQMV